MLKKFLLGVFCTLFFSISAQAVDFKWLDEQNQVHALAQDYKNQAVVVHIWASWCPPCVAEMPDMAAWLQKHGNVKVVAVSVDSNLQTAKAFLNKNNIALTPLLTDQEQAAHLRVRGLPTTLLIDAKGQIITTRVGMQDWQDKAWTDSILALFP